MYKLIPVLFIISIFGISGCATNKTNDKSIKKLISALNEVAPYAKILDQFTAAAKNKNINKMIELTSISSIKMYGLPSFKNTYKNIFIPEITSCNKIYSNKKMMVVSKESTKIGKGYIFQKICTKSKGKPSIMNIKVLNDNGRISVGAVLIFKPNK